MGSPLGEAGRDAGETRHRRHIEQSFAISMKEVTVTQYRRFLAQNPDVLNVTEHEEVKPYMPSADCPVVGVVWYEAARYCNWLSQREGIPESQWCYPKEIKPGMKLPADYLSRSGYRLPTEAEWEYACRAGSSARRPQGASDLLLGQYAWYIDNASNYGHPVGQKKPNDLGLCDMLGNAMEWSQDRCVPYRPAPDGKPVADSPIDETVDDGTTRTIRGGGIHGRGAFSRPARRLANRPLNRYADSGFRVARTYP
jgi:formylglycine-generating enzyme required for sulfatase activity